jgi:hypothetical protein
MDENNAHTPHGGPGHETSDINVWAVSKFAFALSAVIILSLALLFGLMKYFQSQEAHEKARNVEPEQLFPEPRLQSKPIPDLQKFREQEEKTLTTYGWVDQSKGVVRIPIDRAIDVVAQKGLPSRNVTQASRPAPSAKQEGRQ